ncbi:MAG TPA: hypothetical protein VMA74_13830 [Dyella sp.]|uniref:hypothetical protein n=1 Tax=Dyella sp. TaxID=1869338 RepID=UPI002BF7A0E9|nr:hypothetical protein [Dyella sp.]HUB90799.1 hypothetical protein [Dyella sp.]
MLLDRAQALLELNLRFNPAEGKTLEWGFHGNRPALRLIAQHIHGDALRPASNETLACVEWMLALTANDFAPKAVPMLLAASVKPPPHDAPEGFITHGSELPGVGIPGGLSAGVATAAWCAGMVAGADYKAPPLSMDSPRSTAPAKAGASLVGA